VMWSTDFPVVLHSEGRKQIDELGLKDNAKLQLLRECAKKVYKL
jgi:predicted TIM-barrel fold metal-dependent hydrolase